MKRAQTVLEYAMLIFIVVAALVAMGLYIQRGINAKLKVTEIRINEATKVEAICGNCKCEKGENCSNCEIDCCGCGDGACNSLCGENALNCPQDCEYPCDLKCYPYNKHLFRCESPCCKKCDWCDPDAEPPCKV